MFLLICIIISFLDKILREINYFLLNIYKACNFFCILYSHAPFNFILYSHHNDKCKFSGGKKMVVQWKILSLFREVSGVSIIAIINNCYCQIFPYINYLINLVLILLYSHDTLNKGQHKMANIVMRAKSFLKNDQLLSLYILLASFLQEDLSSTSLIMVYIILTVS